MRVLITLFLATVMAFGQRELASPVKLLPSANGASGSELDLVSPNGALRGKVLIDPSSGRFRLLDVTSGGVDAITTTLTVTPTPSGLVTAAVVLTSDGTNSTEFLESNGFFQVTLAATPGGGSITLAQGSSQFGTWNSTSFSQKQIGFTTANHSDIFFNGFITYVNSLPIAEMGQNGVSGGLVEVLNPNIPGTPNVLITYNAVQVVNASGTVTGGFGDGVMTLRSPDGVLKIQGSSGGSGGNGSLSVTNSVGTVGVALQGAGTVNALTGYQVNSVSGVTGATCTQFTGGICTHL